MPTLHWIGKDKVINHHMDVPFKVLEHSYGFDNGTQTDQETNSGNKIIYGDNLEALKALLPEYEGRIKCIYIDPPYNTGNEGWVYNDNVNDPKIKKWLGQVVGKESEDLSRHDKWLCMMYPRLKLLHKLLSDDGVIFISIDDNEQANLKLICDEIFGSSNLITPIYTQVRFAGKTLVEDADIQKLIEITYVYKKKSTTKLIKETAKYDFDKFKYRVIEKGEPTTITLGDKRVDIFEKDNYEIVEEEPSLNHLKEIWATGKILDGNSSGRFFRDYLIGREKEDGLGTLYKVFGIGEDQFPYRYFTGPKKATATKGKYFQGVPNDVLSNSENKEKFLPIPNFENYAEDFGNIRHEGSMDFRSGKKPTVLLQKLINYIIPKDTNAIVLDCFAGSGSTAHAVLNLNKLDSGKRKFITIEMMDYAETTTAQRIKNVIKGYGTTEGTGGSFDFYELGQPMFLGDGNLNELVGVEKIRQYVYYTETKTPLTASKHKDNKHYLGKHNDTAYYFHYEQDEVTTLDHAFLATMKTKAEQYVIYADNCLLTKDFMTKHNIIFKKIPRDITRF
ncbi:site-specific DNA-methyltransferase [Flavobacterium sp. j3]|uniref:site-specific DNA-methyltransferase (adenine-specific) n=1 Tax=Flavobacterium aureirubrum TaxID=3133147 RepID=A0ABU9NBW0_9FLAO